MSVVVGGPVEIRRHDREVARARLAVVRPAHLDARDLGKRIRSIGRFERPREQVVLANRLRAVARIDARRSEEQDALDAVRVRRFQDVRLDAQVAHQEIDRISVVGENATDLRRGQHDDLRPALLEKAGGRRCILEVELRVRSRHELAPSDAPQLAHDGRADEPPMPRDEDGRRTALGHSWRTSVR
jgi:hypothetical protein